LSLAESSYQKPPRAVLDLLDVPAAPVAAINPTRTHLLLVHKAKYPPIADLAQPMLRLAGLRIDPQTNGPHAPDRFAELRLLSLADRRTQPVTFPQGASGPVVWSPLGDRFALTRTTNSGVELWLGQVKDASLHQIGGVRLNAVLGQPIHWLPQGKGLVCQIVPADRGELPVPAQAPTGPVIQESAGKAAPVRTFQDLLQNELDEQRFDYYATAQLVRVDADSGKVTPLGKPGIFGQVSPSPDGRYLLVSRIHRPYSYLLTLQSFPRDVEVWDLQTGTTTTIARLPLADHVPIEGVPTGPRQVQWQPLAEAGLVWVEALDEGDPRHKVPHRDRILTLTAPFTAQPTEFARTEHRYAGLSWLEGAQLALLRDYDRERRWSRTFLLDLVHPGEPRLLWDLSINDHYKDPGDPLGRTLPSGHRIVQQHGSAIFLAGQGATPKGDRPFLDRVDLKTGETTRLFQSAADCYESPFALVTNDGATFLTRHESPTSPPNFNLFQGGKRMALTHDPDPAPALRGIHRELVTYKRADGVPLSFTLYLPPGYQKGQRLPAIVWAYPREFVDPDTAGQVIGSTQRFTTITGPSHLFFLTQGYAILDGATMPVVGSPAEANNTYVEQIVASAKAAIDKADALGAIDPKRVGVGGHSYGAFMTANLLAHSDLFRAGIARSGAYNRTLTPFGFQNERRTLWEAPDIYGKMSPFMAAHKIKVPLLLIHGAADNNPGTFPMQSERMYQAIKGNGGIARYVVLPHESHAYHARESIEHTLFEMLAWFDRYVKGATNP
jgi:dipeptidyl aminopeptidase/acylaminoacyl peptidase